MDLGGRQGLQMRVLEKYGCHCAGVTGSCTQRKRCHGHSHGHAGTQTEQPIVNETRMRSSHLSLIGLHTQPCANHKAEQNDRVSLGRPSSSENFPPVSEDCEMGVA
jgi:hypothetical protein